MASLSQGNNSSRKIEYFERSRLCSPERDAFEAQNNGDNWPLSSPPAYSANQAYPPGDSELEEEKAFSTSQVSTNWRKKFQKTPIFPRKKVWEKNTHTHEKKNIHNLAYYWVASGYTGKKDAERPPLKNYYFGTYTYFFYNENSKNGLKIAPTLIAYELNIFSNFW